MEVVVEDDVSEDCVGEIIKCFGLFAKHMRDALGQTPVADLMEVVAQIDEYTHRRGFTVSDQEIISSVINYLQTIFVTMGEEKIFLSARSQHCSNALSRLLESCLKYLTDAKRDRSYYIPIGYIILSLGEKGEPFSSSILNTCLKQLLILTLCRNSGMVEQNVLLSAVSTLCFHSDFTNVETFTSASESLCRLAKKLTTLSMESQMSVFRILSASLSCRTEAYEKAKIWFENHSIRNIFTKYYSNNQKLLKDKNCGMFVGEILDLNLDDSIIIIMPSPVRRHSWDSKIFLTKKSSEIKALPLDNGYQSSKSNEGKKEIACRGRHYSSLDTGTNLGTALACSTPKSDLLLLNRAKIGGSSSSSSNWLSSSIIHEQLPRNMERKASLNQQSLKGGECVTVKHSTMEPSKRNLTVKEESSDEFDKLFSEVSNLSKKSERKSRINTTWKKKNVLWNGISKFRSQKERNSSFKRIETVQQRDHRGACDLYDFPNSCECNDKTCQLKRKH